MWDFLLNASRKAPCRVVHPPAPQKVLMAASASILRTQHEQERNKERQDRKLATRFDPYTKPMDQGSPPKLTAAEESFTKPYGQVLGAHAVPKRMVARSPTVQDVLSMVAERERSSTSIRRERAKSKKRMMAKLKMHKRTCIVDPRMSKYLAYWDTVTMLAIVFTALVTPYEIAFLPMATSATEPLFIINRFMDVIFIVDMIITFRMMYTAADGEDATMWIADPMRIAVHYLKGWFLLDFVSIAISGLDIVGVMEQGSSLSGLRVLRILRAARLIKLVRLLRASRILKRWETRIAVDYSSLEMMKCLLSLLLSSHWFGCVWTLQANLMTDSVLDSWLGERGYCEAFESAGGELASGASSNPSADDAHAVLDCPVDRECRVDFPGVACYPGATIWAAAVYWAVMTITSIGYGDLPATPYNAGEMWVCTTLMLLGGGIWGYVIGTFVSVIANLGPATREFRRNMDDLNSWMARHGMDPVAALTAARVLSPDAPSLRVDGREQTVDAHVAHAPVGGCARSERQVAAQGVVPGQPGDRVGVSRQADALTRTHGALPRRARPLWLPLHPLTRRGRARRPDPHEERDLGRGHSAHGRGARPRPQAQCQGDQLL